MSEQQQFTSNELDMIYESIEFNLNHLVNAYGFAETDTLMSKHIANLQELSVKVARLPTQLQLEVS